MLKLENATIGSKKLLLVVAPENVTNVDNVILENNWTGFDRRKIVDAGNNGICTLYTLAW